MPRHHHRRPELEKHAEGGGHDPEILGGTIVQFNFSPRGGVEGLLLRNRDRTFQVNVPPDAWPLIGHAVAIGHEARVAAVPEPESPKHGAGEHPVYRLVTLDPPEESPEDGPASVAGIVARFNYARHGEVNGVVLEDGDFVHLKPDGVKKLGLRVGQHIEAAGKARRMMMGRRVIEAEIVDGVVLARNWLRG